MSTFKCHVCGGETAREEFVSEVLEVDGRRVLVEHIPAQVCTRCAEAAFSRETTERSPRPSLRTGRLCSPSSHVASRNTAPLSDTAYQHPLLVSDHAQ